MDAHQVLDVIACVGHLAFAAFALSRFQKSPLAFPLALLFLDAFAWNFADLAYELSGAIEWHLIDRFFSSFMPALMLHLIVVFVGKTRALRWTVRAAYVASLALSAMLLKPWWMFLGIVSLLIMCLCITLVVKHRVTSNDPEERSRADLMLLAVALGTALGTTDLWHNEVGFFVPRLSNLGILIGLAMMAVAALRLRLLGREVRPAPALYALLGGALWVTAYLAAVRWFEPHQGVYVLSVATALAFGIAVVREARRAQSVARERVQRLAVLGRFSDQLAHDLRNPLAALKGALQFLAVEREQGRSIDAQSGFLDLMLGQVARLQNVIDNYQRIAKVEPVLARGSLNDVVRDVLGLQRFAVVSGVNLKTELSEELPECDMDRELIATTLENILRNAYEAMPSGGTVTVRTERGGVDSLLLSVQDEGQGMDPRELSRATDEFFTTKATGTGLGLNFAARVARAHGGTLSLTSNVNRGTTVRLRIPLGRA